MAKKKFFSINPTNKKAAKKSLSEIAKGANRIIGDNIQGGWLEVIGQHPDASKDE